METKPMKEIKQGTIYGYDVVLKVPADFPDDDMAINKHTLDRYIENIKKNPLFYGNQHP